MARPQFVQARPTVLDVSISDTENTEIVLQKLVAVGNVPLTMADFGDILELTFNPGGTNEEIVSCTGFTVADDGRVTINAGILRARSGKTPYTSGGQAYNHAAGTQVIVSNNAQMYDRILTYAEGMANAGAADASLTGKGLVEGATTAEVNSGTELGATGAMLFVNPLYLASSIYGTRLPSAAEKAKLAEILGVSFFAGDGSDGPLNVTSGTYTIDLSVKTVWQFSSVNISLGATVNFSGGTGGDKVPVIKCKGNFVNAGTITTVGLGPAGGTGGAALNNGTAAGTAGSGTHGTGCLFTFLDGTLPGSGRLGTGASRATGGNDGTGGTGGAIAPRNTSYAFYPYAINGTGGGGGGGGLSANVGTPGNGGPGGAGSLGLIIEVGGNFTNSGTINLNGQNGTNGAASVGNGINSWTSGSGGGGGGGGAGSFILRYQGTFTNSGTITANGGTAGAGGLSTNKGASGGSPVMGAGGGGGSGGANSYNATAAASNGGSELGGAGSAGANGIIFMEKVTS